MCKKIDKHTLNSFVLAVPLEVIQRLQEQNFTYIIKFIETTLYITLRKLYHFSHYFSEIFYIFMGHFNMWKNSM
jgi:hypothetical protein